MVGSESIKLFGKKLGRQFLTKLSDAMAEPSYARLWQNSSVFRQLFQKSERYLLDQLGKLEQLPTGVSLMQRPLYFLHIPKTAGSSLKYWLADLFAPGEVLETYTLSGLEQALPEKINYYRFYSGHLGFALYDFLGDRTLIDTFTWLRDPAKREISQYNFIRQTKDSQMGMFLSPELKNYVESASSLTLAELCHSDSYQGYYDNLQTQMLGGFVPPQAYGRELIEADLDSGPGDCPSGSKGGTVENDSEHQRQKALRVLRRCQRRVLEGGDTLTLDAAKQSLLALAHFGLCEWMQPSVDLFCYHFGLLPMPFNYRLNESQRQSKALSAEDLAIVRQHNTLDYDLYAFALEEFQRRIVGMWQDCLGYDELAARFLSESSLGRHLREGSPVAQVGLLLENWEMPEVKALIHHCLIANFQQRHRLDQQYSRFLFSFSKATFWTGWFPREYSEKLKTLVRWAGPDQDASVLLPLRPGPDYRLVFKVLHYASVEILQTLRLFVGAEEIFLQRVAVTEGSEDGAYLFVGLVPARLIKESQPYTQITFRIDQGDYLKLPTNPALTPNHAGFALDSLLAEGMS